MPDALLRGGGVESGDDDGRCGGSGARGVGAFGWDIRSLQSWGAVTRGRLPIRASKGATLPCLGMTAANRQLRCPNAATLIPTEVPSEFGIARGQQADRGEPSV